MRILVLGSGGREHALAWRLAQDPERPKVAVAPGNDGMAQHFTRFAVQDTDPADVVALVTRERFDLIVIGPEAPLAAGVSDALVAAGFRVSGASQAAAQLESSKWFAKQVMLEADVPTARAQVFERTDAALAALDAFGPTWVVKADGLAAGKGVLVSRDRDETSAFVRDCLEGGRFGAGGARVVFEEFLAGEEASIMAVCDGERHVLLPAARDYKRAFAGDAGPNTGGMGSYAPTPAVTTAIEAEVSARIVTPVLRVLASRGTPYRGALYVGLMLTAAGPRVIEFNARFGDPETQSILPLVEGSLARLLASAASGSLDAASIARRAGAAVTVALVDEGYPDAVRGGGVLGGLAELDPAQVTVFHAGTRLEDGQWRVRGGRAAYLMATAATIEQARASVERARMALSGTGWRSREDVAAHVSHTTRNA